MSKLEQKKFILKSEYKPSGDQPEAIKKLVKNINNGTQYQTLLGVTGSGKTFTMANIIAKLNHPCIILAPNKTLAAQLYGEFKEYFPDNAVGYFVSYYDYYQPEAYVPSSDLYIEKDASINSHIEQLRLSATKSLLNRSDSIIIASVSSIYGLGNPENYQEMSLTFKLGEYFNERDIIRSLANMQYTRTNGDLTRSKFRVRGEIIDIFPAEEEIYAVRIELFDDEIEQINYFDPLTGHIKNKVSEINIYPKTHYVTPKEQITDVVKSIKKDLKIQLINLENNGKLLEAQRLKERTSYDIEMLNELGYCNGIENYSRYLTKSNPGDPPPTLFDYLPKNAIMFIDESHVTIPQLGAMYKGDYSRKKNLVDYGFRLPVALDNRPLKLEEWEKLAPKMIFVSATPSTYEAQHSSIIVEQLIRPTAIVDPIIQIKPASSQVDSILAEIRTEVKNNNRVLITVLTKRLAEELTEFLMEYQIKVKYLHSEINTVERVEIIRKLRQGIIDVIVGINLLREGLDMPEVALVAIFDADKEGFLRSERSLIQTIGRAARNVKGRVILYADKITKSIQSAMDETQRRRNKQLAYNKKYNLKPTTLNKNINDIMEIDKYSQEIIKNKKDVKSIDDFNEEGFNLESINFLELTKKIKKLEKQMNKAASDLNFELAVKYRDLLLKAKDILLKNK